MGGPDDDRSGLSRREFLKMAGAGAAKVVIPDFGIPDPPEPKLKSREVLTGEEIISMSQPILMAMNFVRERTLARRCEVDVPKNPILVEGNIIPGHSVWERDFPGFSLTQAQDVLKMGNKRFWEIPENLCVYTYPKFDANTSYSIPLSIYPVTYDSSTGFFSVDGLVPDVIQRSQRFLPDEAIKILPHRGWLGALWSFETTEWFGDTSIKINWLGKRGGTFGINSKASLETPTDRMASIFNDDTPTLYFQDAKGRNYGFHAPATALFIPIGVEARNFPEKPNEWFKRRELDA